MNDDLDRDLAWVDRVLALIRRLHERGVVDDDERLALERDLVRSLGRPR